MPASAQSQFEGAFVQADVGYRYVMPTISSTNLVGSGVRVQNGAPVSVPINSPITSNITSKGAIAAAISAGYFAQVNEYFLLGVGADYTPIAGPEGNIILTTTLNNASRSFTGVSQMQNGYNIYLSPATMIGEDALIYGKFGYTSAIVKVTVLNSSVSNNFNGHMFGIGYKQMITGGLYGYCEANYAIYNNNTTSRNPTLPGASASAQITSGSTTLNAMVGLGYKF